MTITCQNNRSNYPPLVLPLDLTREFCDDNYIASSEWYTIDAEYSGYSITIGKEYQVFGILTYDNQIRYLILDDYGIPGFFPSTLFYIQKNEIFFDWQICNYSIESATLLYIGCPIFCESYNNLIDLICKKNSAIYNLLLYKDFVARYEY